MSNYLSGADALQAMNESGNDNEFSKFSSGTSYLVKVLGTTDLVQFYSYGVYKKTYSFVAENPSEKDNGFPTGNLTVWDRAFLHIRNPDEEYNSPTNQEAYKYRAKERYMMGFYDVKEGELIVVDLSKKQAQAIHGSITSNRGKLNDLVFKLEKTGTGQSTQVSLSVVDNVANLKKMKDAGIEADSALTSDDIENFYKAPEAFDSERFKGCLYEANEDEMIVYLDQAGFDVSELGLEVPVLEEEDKAEGSPSTEGNGTSLDIDSEDVPF